MASTEPSLTVAVTGPTGTFGSALMPLLEADDRIGRVIGIARRPFDPAAHGWSKMIYAQGDVRDPGALETAFEGADVVVHLAFLITGTSSGQTIRDINIGGTLNAFQAAAAAGATRFVYASSVAAYGFHPDNPVGMTEEWPIRPARRLFYAQEKAELEGLLAEEAAAHPEIDLYLLRPPVVVGPHAVGAKDLLPGPLAPLGRRALAGLSRLRVPLPLPLPIPDVPLQVIHEDDVGQALLCCVVAAGPPDAYNIAADDIISPLDIARELGLRPIPIPATVVHGSARAVSNLPRPSLVPPVVEWIEALSHPAIMDTAKAQRELGWRPRWSAADALRDTVRPGS